MSTQKTPALTNKLGTSMWPLSFTPDTRLGKQTGVSVVGWGSVGRTGFQTEQEDGRTSYISTPDTRLDKQTRHQPVTSFPHTRHTHWQTNWTPACDLFSSQHTPALTNKLDTSLWPLFLTSDTRSDKLDTSLWAHFLKPHIRLDGQRGPLSWMPVKTQVLKNWTLSPKRRRTPKKNASLA